MKLVKLHPSLMLALCLLVAAPVWSKGIKVPEDFPSIQSAIDAAPVSGTEIEVAPGRYVENLVIVGKSIRIMSKKGAKRTVIDGGNRSAVVVIAGTGSEKVALVGFKLTNGFNSFGNPIGSGGGGAVRVDLAHAVIEENIIEGNTACFGGAIFSQEASIEVRRNVITGNRQEEGCSGANGGGIYMNGSAQINSVISDNEITGHRIGGYGSGITINAVRGVTITKNDIKDNWGVGYGGGLFVDNSSAEISRNLFEGNIAGLEGSSGGGVAIIASDISNRINVADNDFRANQADYGSAAMFAAYYDDGLRIVKNNMKGKSAGPLVYCSGAAVTVPKSNHLKNSLGPDVDGSCMR